MKKIAAENKGIIWKRREVRLIEVKDRNKNSGRHHLRVGLFLGGQQTTHEDAFKRCRFFRNRVSQLGIFKINEEPIVEVDAFLHPETFMTRLKFAPPPNAF